MPGAILVSACAHGALIALAMWSVSDEVLHIPAGASGGEAGAVTVTLVGPLGALGGGQPTPVQARAPSELDAMMQKFRSNEPARASDQARPSAGGGAAQLFKEIAEARQNAAGHGKASSPADSQGESVGYDLWGKIRPCWRPASGVVVTLDVTVDSQGRLAWAPKPVRAGGTAADPGELLAESMAVQAAVRCAPYGNAAPAAGEKTFRIVFSQ